MTLPYSKEQGEKHAFCSEEITLYGVPSLSLFGGAPVGAVPVFIAYVN